MAGSRSTVFVGGEFLIASTLETELSQWITQDQSIGTPRTSEYQMGGFQLKLSSNGKSGILADTADRIDLVCNSVDLFRFDGTVASVLNGLDFIGSAASTEVKIQVTSVSSTNVDVNVIPLGTGDVGADGMSLNTLTYQVFA